ncbi:MAG: hypothetical protein EPO40_33800 [Myxococcaceae bacterium]|nr:MAG: hypothetical protein EPO40_33800 [Myxococcaceae bacterium]
MEQQQMVNTVEPLEVRLARHFERREPPQDLIDFSDLDQWPSKGALAAAECRPRPRYVGFAMREAIA